MSPVRILLADDHILVRAGIRALLEGLEGVTVVAEAGNGSEVLELARTHRPDVVLLDIQMPGLDGQGLYEQLRKVKPDMARRFIFSTGDLANPKVQTFFQATGSLYLSKPFKLESVLRVLDQVAERLRAA